MASISLLAPGFDPTFFGNDYALPVFGKKANMPISALPALAALTPPEHQVTLTDVAVEPFDFDRIAEADIVGLTGMSVQRFRMMEVAREIKARGALLAIGGPWVTVQDDYFEGLADVIFIGEADTTWPQFLEDWSRGEHKPRYDQAARTDMTTVPQPRFDLLDLSQYLAVGVQVSRGCPFRCEFCDIIVTFGRVPRVKTADQVITELEALRIQDVRAVFIVDDNFIGNKKLIRPILDAIIEWQQQHNYSMTLSTEASINLAEEEELLDMMVEVNFSAVFVGVESPSEEALKETKRVQNLKRRNSEDAHSLADDIIRRLNFIQSKGISVQCGMIVGFDSDHPDVFDKQKTFVDRTGVSTVLVGMLAAIPSTPLYTRLEIEGRLDRNDRPAFGTNVVPLNMTREQLQDGYVWLLNELYEPGTFFARWDEEFDRVAPRVRRALEDRCPSVPRRAVSALFGAMTTVMGYARLKRAAGDPALMRVNRRQILRYLGRHRGLSALMMLPDYFFLSAPFHFHYHTLAREMAAGKSVRNSF